MLTSCQQRIQNYFGMALQIRKTEIYKVNIIMFTCTLNPFTVSDTRFSVWSVVRTGFGLVVVFTVVGCDMTFGDTL